MPGEEQKLPYQRRIFDTKTLSQRVNLFYFLRPNVFRDSRRRLTLWATVLAALATVPFLLNLGGGEQVFSNGPLSQAHAIFEQDCSLCHTETFSVVPDAACIRCHDGPPHVNTELAERHEIGEIRCGECHAEHRGAAGLAAVHDGNCTRCHAGLDTIVPGAGIRASAVSAFRRESHPNFPAPDKNDARPLRLNHAVHTPAEPKRVRNIELPVNCTDCHQTDRDSASGDLLPVTFDQHCRSCHQRELQFDIFQQLGAEAEPAPHSGDPQSIHTFIEDAYEELLAQNPGVPQVPLERGGPPESSPRTWLETIVQRSEAFLFDRKCVYCHEYESRAGAYPVVKDVNLISGQYQAGAARGRPWLEHARFSHRSHRAITCTSCHEDAVTS